MLLRRRVLSFAPFLLSACVCRMGPPGPATAPAMPPPPPPPREWLYVGAHPVPAGLGGGWDDTRGNHAHPYAPEPLDGYRQEGNHYRWTGPGPGDGTRGPDYREGRGAAGSDTGLGTTTTREGADDRDRKKDEKVKVPK